MIQTLIKALKKIAVVDKKVVFLIIDDVEVYEGLYSELPSQTFLVGIAECNAINIAAGLANGGYKPYVVGGDTFLAYRAYEFIRDQVCLENRNVKIIGIGAGLAISVLGNSHSATEDLAILRTIPNLTVVTPATVSETQQLVEEIAELECPVFLRMGRACGDDYYDETTRCQLGKVQIVQDGKDLLVLSTGTIISDIINAVKEINDYTVGIVNIHTIKPLDVAGLIELAKDYNKWLVVDEANLAGGLGSAIGEIILDNNLPVQLTRLGLADIFPEGAGGYQELKAKNGLGIFDIKNACIKVMS